LKAIVRRLARLEGRFVPRETEESRQILERLRKARERAAKDTEQPYQELPPLLPTNNGHPRTLVDCLLAGRERARRQEAAQQQ
jgi:hypothetical protein